jgi:hypothetical protein
MKASASNASTLSIQCPVAGQFALAGGGFGSSGSDAMTQSAPTNASGVAQTATGATGVGWIVTFASSMGNKPTVWVMCGVG